MVRKRRPPTLPADTMEYLLEYENSPTVPERTCRQRWCKYCLVTWIIIFIVLLLIFISIAVIIPVIFMNSVDLQRTLVFATWNIKEKQNFSNFRRYGMDGARNLYVTTNANGNIELGVWHVLPLEYEYDAAISKNFNYKGVLSNSPYPVVLYFHGTGGNRITNNNMYRVLRRFFHVIAFDYRSYGDSTHADLSEEAVVHDGVEMYKWLRSQTNANIYVWGYSLGTGISTHVVAKLYREGIVPTGLFLESPFTTFREELEYFPLVKLLAWLPWFDATIANPLQENGFRFNTLENILSVNCPILIVHAEDDRIIPYTLGKKLSKVARDMRAETQGSITFYSFPAHYGFGHKKIYEAAELPDYINTHINICREYNKGKG